MFDSDNDGGLRFHAEMQEQRRQEEEWLANELAQIEYQQFLDSLNEEFECPRLGK